MTATILVCYYMPTLIENAIKEQGTTFQPATLAFQLRPLPLRHRHARVVFIPCGKFTASGKKVPPTGGGLGSNINTSLFNFQQGISTWFWCRKLFQDIKNCRLRNGSVVELPILHFPPSFGMPTTPHCFVFYSVSVHALHEA